MKRMIQNFTTLVASFLIIICFLEFIFFRLIFPAPDVPRNAFSDGVIKYQPNQTGVKWVKSDYRCLFRINNEGWNSKYDHYQFTKSHKNRIVIIGDSYVEAFMVDLDKSLAEELEAKLRIDKYEVYRFGIGGAPLSQYLQILRKEAIKYAPDYVVIVMIHNDFDESYEYRPGRCTSSFLKLQIGEKGVIEIPPEPYTEKWIVSFLRSSAIFRFFYFGERIHPPNLRRLKRLIHRREKTESTLPIWQGNIDITHLAEKRGKNIITTEYVFREMEKLARQRNFKLLIIMDGDRQSIYQGKEAPTLYENGALSLNRLAAVAAEKINIPFIDLHPIFARDYQLHQKKFDYPHDSHWNAYGHKIVAETIYKYWCDHSFGQQGATSSGKVASGGRDTH
jgi:hypothetical protein